MSSHSERTNVPSGIEDNDAEEISRTRSSSSASPLRKSSSPAEYKTRPTSTSPSFLKNSPNTNANPLHRLVEQRRDSIEEQRLHRAMYSSETFFKELLPYLEEFKIISRTKVGKLQDEPEQMVEGSLSTRELMSLAIKWQITTSAAHFWANHKTKSQLVHKLRVRKAELELPPPQDEEGMIEIADTAQEDVPEVATEEMRRNSLTKLQRKMGTKAYFGDKFGTRGHYMGGLIYASRQNRKESDPLTTSPGLHTEEQLPNENESEGSQSVLSGERSREHAGADDDENGWDGNSSLGKDAEGDNHREDENSPSFNEDSYLGHNFCSPSEESAPERRQRTSSAICVQAFEESRQARAKGKWPPLKPGQLLSIEEFIDRHDFESLNDHKLSEDEKQYALQALSDAICIEQVHRDGDSELENSTARSTLGNTGSTAGKERQIYSPVQEHSIPLFRADRDVMKTLRGVTGVAPYPSPEVRARAESKMRLYLCSLRKQPKTEVYLPRQKQHEPVYPKGVVEMRQKQEEHLQEESAKETSPVSFISRPKEPRERFRLQDDSTRFSHQGLVSNELSREDLPNPLHMPNPSHPIMEATTGTGTGIGVPTQEISRV